MTGAGVVLAKNGMVNDCCSHLCFCVLTTQNKVKRAYDIETSLDSFPRFIQYFHFGTLFAKAEFEDQGQISRCELSGR
jgi:hypothetical protein